MNYVEIDHLLFKNIRIKWEDIEEYMKQQYLGKEVAVSEDGLRIINILKMPSEVGIDMM